MANFSDQVTTLAVGEEAGGPTTLAVGEESGPGRPMPIPTTQAYGEEASGGPDKYHALPPWFR